MILTVAVLGPDRPGVVAALAEVLLREHGNLEDASMTVLRGQFAMTLVVDVPLTAAQARPALAEVADRLGLVVTVAEVGPQLAAAAAGSAPYVLSVHGADQPGLVHRVAALLAGHDANITDLGTRLVGEPGRAAYVIVVSCDVPPGAQVPLGADVAALAAELGVDAVLRPVDPDEL